MKKIAILILLSGCLQVQCEAPICTSAAWLNDKQQCADTPGGFVDESGKNCKLFKGIGKGQPGQVCCAGCTSNGLESAGID